MNKSLTGKTALVTGAASGIGKHIAQILAQHGASVAVADVNQEGLDKCVEEIRNSGGDARGIWMDVSDEGSVNSGVASIASGWDSKIDILIANAGMQIVHPLVDFPFNDWKKLLSIHLDGSFLTTKAVLPYMYKDKRGGVVIFTGSVHSHEASPLKAAYVTAKHGLLGLSRVLAKEGASNNVRSHVICPGFVNTPLVERQIPQQAESLGISEEEVVKKVMLGKTVNGEFTSLEDVSELVLFLCTYPSAALTGQSFVVSHGWFMQ